VVVWDSTGAIVDGDDDVLAILDTTRDDLPFGGCRVRDPELHASAACETELLRADGTRVPVLLRGLRSERGDGRVGVVLDLRGRSRAERFERLGMLAGGILHDFGNLLTAILGNADLALAALPEGSPACAALRRIEATARRASALTRQMLAGSASEGSRIEPVDLSGLVDDTLSSMDRMLPIGAAVRVRLAGDLPPIEGDPCQLGQLVMNLVANAAEALGGMPGTVDVATGSGSPAEARERGSWIWFEVADTGSGMEPATRARMFEPFFSTKPDGRGLGLAIVQSVVRSHRGRLTVDTEPGLGTRLRVWFPRAAARTGDA
jgi:two-component system cell cycle sensor histidine kinase/response regulator CckA